MEHTEQGRDEAIDLPRLIVGVRRRRRWIYLSAIAAALLSSAFVLFASPTTRRRRSAARGSGELLHPAGQGVGRPFGGDDRSRGGAKRGGGGHEPQYGAQGDRKARSCRQSRVRGFRRRREQRPPRPVGSRQVPVAPLGFPGAPSPGCWRSNSSRAIPGLAARAANTVAEVFLQSQEEAKAETARAAGAWLSRKIDELRGKVADADAKVEAYRTQAGLFAGANGQTVPVEQLTDLNTQLANARSALATANAKAALLRSLQQAGRLDDAPEWVAEKSMRRIANERVTLKAELAEASRTLLPMCTRASRR